MSVQENCTYTDATFTEGAYDCKEIPATPLHQLSGRPDVSLPLDLQVGVGVQYVGDSHLAQDFDNAGTKLPDYTVVDLSIRYSPSIVKGLDVFLAVRL